MDSDEFCPDSDNTSIIYHCRFSSIGIDHAHEQNNKLAKDDGGAIGLTENDD